MKMRGKRKKWGRCKLHGQHCEVSHEIRENTSTRASEKEESTKEINQDLISKSVNKDSDNVY